VRNLSAVTLDDLVEEVASWQVSRAAAREVVTGTIDRAVAAVSEPEIDETVRAIVTGRAATLLGEIRA
jgi:hypothetical protein